MKRKFFPKMRPFLAACLIATLAVPLSLPAGTGKAAPAHVDNPFTGATAYLNPDYAQSVDMSIARVGDEELAAKMETVKSYPTAVWLDRIAAIHGGEVAGGRLSLEEHLDNALAQQQGDTPITASFVIYNLPGRDCHALASNGELPLTQAALQRYKTEYIDVIANLFADSKYEDIRIIAVIEPDSLPNLVTNLNDPACAAANSTNIYRDAVRYTLDQLADIPNVYKYLDIGHSGWLGWDSNLQPAVNLYTSVVQGTQAGLDSVDGFITNTANTTPLVEPNLPDSNLNINGQPIRSAKYYEWNPYFDEADFTAALYSGFVAKGWPSDIGFLIDTSRNGWGGPDRPTGASGSDINTYVNSGRIDKRLHRGNWCNAAGAGMGARPEADPQGYPHVDALVWVKPPGDSDGSSTQIPNDEGKGFDRMCDPTYTTSNGTLTGALPNAPISGHWFHDQFVELVKNAYPAIPLTDNGGGNTPPAAPARVTATAGAQQVKLDWNAVRGAENYIVKRAASASGPFVSIAETGIATTYTDTDVMNGTAYFYVISAVNAVGTGPDSAVASATPAVLPAPAAPAGLAVEAGDAQVKLTWNAESAADGYNVKRALSESGPFETIAESVTGTAYTDNAVENGTTYYYVVSAVNTSGESADSGVVSAAPQEAPRGDLAVQYRNGDSSATDNQIRPHFNIKNNGQDAVQLSDLKLRYYFTKDGSEAMQSWVDWAQIGSSNVTVTFTDSYMEVGFTSGAGTLAPGGQTGEIQTRVAKSNWSNFDETDDYSYDATKTSFADWEKVTLYQDGALVWGIEP
ncbi:glycoside hydrolase family 6 protein [Paenibacillus medicaginis]|uniref:Glucanase n=1 Tax=Paenibacillus medicaginis TaxID=1470560 RepID=A0ABV5BZ27_9BACL